MLSAFDKVRLARQFIYTFGRSITDKSKLFASLLQPRRFSQEYADTTVYAPRGITKQLWRAAAVLAHVFKLLNTLLQLSQPSSMRLHVRSRCRERWRWV